MDLPDFSSPLLPGTTVVFVTPPPDSPEMLGEASEMASGRSLGEVGRVDYGHFRYDSNLDVIMELQALLPTLPAGAKVTVERVVIEIPGSSLPIDPRDGPPAGGGTPADPSASPNGGRDPDPLRKVKEAVGLVDGVSVREVDRAIKAGHIPHEIKEVGRDAGARMVRVSDLLLYRDQRDAIRQGGEEDPEGWQCSGGRS